MDFSQDNPGAEQVGKKQITFKEWRESKPDAFPVNRLDAFLDRIAVGLRGRYWQEWLCTGTIATATFLNRHMYISMPQNGGHTVVGLCGIAHYMLAKGINEIPSLDEVDWPEKPTGKPTEKKTRPSPAGGLVRDASV